MNAAEDRSGLRATGKAFPMLRVLLLTIAAVCAVGRGPLLQAAEQGTATGRPAGPAVSPPDPAEPPGDKPAPARRPRYRSNRLRSAASTGSRLVPGQPGCRFPRPSICWILPIEFGGCLAWWRSWESPITCPRTGAISRRVVFWGLVLQWSFALLVLRVPAGVQLLRRAGDGVEAMLNCALAGAEFVFGKGLVDREGPAGFVFAFRVLPTVIFVAALFAVLYHLGVMQRVVRVFAGSWPG